MVAVNHDLDILWVFVVSTDKKSLVKFYFRIWCRLIQTLGIRRIQLITREFLYRIKSIVYIHNISLDSRTVRLSTTETIAETAG